MLVEPATADGLIVDRLAAKLAGAVLTDSGGNPACTLGPLPDEKVMDFYTRQAQVWRSVTPVILHGFNATRGQISLTKTDNLLARAFEMAGYAPGDASAAPSVEVSALPRGGEVPQSGSGAGAGGHWTPLRHRPLRGGGVTRNAILLPDLLRHLR
jgi:hypothetical protein